MLIITQTCVLVIRHWYTRIIWFGLLDSILVIDFITLSYIGGFGHHQDLILIRWTALLIYINTYIRTSTIGTSPNYMVKETRRRRLRNYRNRPSAGKEENLILIRATIGRYPNYYMEVKIPEETALQITMPTPKSAEINL